MAIHTRNNKQSANAEFRKTNDEILIPVATNIPVVLSPFSPVLSKTPTKTQIPSTDMTLIQHQIDALRQEIEKNAAENHEFKALIIKKNLLRKGFTNETKQKYFMKKLPSLKKKILKTNKQ